MELSSEAWRKLANEIATHGKLFDFAGEEWSEEAIDLFEELTHKAQWIVIMARTVSYQQTVQGSMPCLELINTQGSQVRCALSVYSSALVVLKYMLSSLLVFLVVLKYRKIPRIGRPCV